MKIHYEDKSSTRWPKAYIMNLKGMLHTINIDGRGGRGKIITIVFGSSYKSYPTDGYVRRSFQYGGDYRKFRIMTGPRSHKVKFLNRTRVFWDTGR
jgi:hypothetical protein